MYSEEFSDLYAVNGLKHTQNFELGVPIRNDY